MLSGQHLSHMMQPHALTKNPGTARGSPPRPLACRTPHAGQLRAATAASEAAWRARSAACRAARMVSSSARLLRRTVSATSSNIRRRDARVVEPPECSMHCSAPARARLSVMSSHRLPHSALRTAPIPSDTLPSTRSLIRTMLDRSTWSCCLVLSSASAWLSSSNISPSSPHEMSSQNGDAASGSIARSGDASSGGGGAGASCVAQLRGAGGGGGGGDAMRARFVDGSIFFAAAATAAAARSRRDIDQDFFSPLDWPVQHHWQHA